MSRPCPFVRCRFHLYLDVEPRSGALKLNFPGLEVHELKQTCALDVAAQTRDSEDEASRSLDEVGDLMNLTAERVRKIQIEAMRKMGLTENAFDPQGDDNGPAE